MDRQNQDKMLTQADEIATHMEQAIKLNGDGAHVIRDLIAAFKNFQQVDDLWELIANRYEKLVEAQDRLLQANLQLQKEMVTVASRVLRLEKKEREQKKTEP
jgi:hypothetical protein